VRLAHAVEGKTTPIPLQVPHEFCAVSMAHGYHLVTGEPPLVMVHTTVGTANALCGLINAARAHIPPVLSAGRTPITESGSLGSRDLLIHWAQESFDQGAMVREEKRQALVNVDCGNVHDFGVH
jgi:acetolactate synthase-1/2/3 large subunit